MNAFNKIHFVAVVAVIFLFAAAIILFRLESIHVESDGEENIYFEITPGMTAGAIADSLYSRDIIESAGYFLMVCKMRGYARHFKAGSHIIDDANSVHGLAHLLTRIPPSPPDIRLTIVEGLNMWETASTVAAETGIDSTEFIRIASNKKTADELKVDNDTLEGYLYPDTYFVARGTTAYELIVRLVNTFNTVFDDSMRTRGSELGMSVNEVVTLASIIETEAQLDEERAIVSQVFHRRLSLNRPLEANPTIQYALRSRRRVLDEDLEIDSPYNTYTYRGLPPGPIASPGKKSLVAALYPADTNYLYFMADGNGGHVFSRSLNEHNRAVRNYKRERARRR